MIKAIGLTLLGWLFALCIAMTMGILLKGLEWTYLIASKLVQL